MASKVIINRLATGSFKNRDLPGGGGYTNQPVLNDEWMTPLISKCSLDLLDIKKKGYKLKLVNFKFGVAMSTSFSATGRKFSVFLVAGHDFQNMEEEAVLVILPVKW